MRLLHTVTYELESYLYLGRASEYAILSHRWYSDEVTYQHLDATKLRCPGVRDEKAPPDKFAPTARCLELVMDRYMLH